MTTHPPIATASVQTVLGPIPAEKLGITLPHEHFFCGSAASNLQEPENPRDRELARQPVSRQIRAWLEYNFHLNLDNLTLADEAVACAEAQRYRQAGGQSIVELTIRGIGRNPLALARLSRQTGLNIIMGCGYYVQATHPPEVAAMTQAQLRDQIVQEFADGMDGTEVRPGVIGEIGCSWPITPDEEKCLRGAADAQSILGAALYIHPGKHPDSLDQIISILRTTPVDMGRVIMCHMERTLQDIPRIEAMLRTGVIAEYDLFGRETTGWYYRGLGIDMLSDAQRLVHLRHLIDDGFLGQLLISHDISFKHMLHTYGGQGYDHILINTLPWMRQRGFTQGEIDAIVIHNPSRLIAIEP